jgi:hypothetical protein
MIFGSLHTVFRVRARRDPSDSLLRSNFCFSHLVNAKPLHTFARHALSLIMRRYRRMIFYRVA